MRYCYLIEVADAIDLCSFAKVSVEIELKVVTMDGLVGISVSSTVLVRRAHNGRKLLMSRYNEDLFIHFTTRRHFFAKTRPRLPRQACAI